jgi:hypothetical protein
MASIGCAGGTVPSGQTRRPTNAGAATLRRMRKRTDRLYLRTLGPRELEALDLIERQPGITIADLAVGWASRCSACGRSWGGWN